MKTQIITIILLINSIMASAQSILLQEKFESTPIGFKSFSVDALTTDCGVSVPNGWILSQTPGFSGAGPDKTALGCSWHANVPGGGKADDWMVTSAIPISFLTTSTDVIAKFSLYNETDPSKLEVYASKNYNGTQAGLSSFTLIKTVTHIEAWRWDEFSVSLASMNLNNGDNVFLAFRNIETGKGYVFFDDLIVQVIPKKEADLRFYDGDIYSKTTKLPIKGSVYNNGSTAINSFILSTSVNGGPISTQTYTGLNIVTGGFYMFQAATIPTYNVGKNNLKMYISNINGTGQDSNPSNDTLIQNIYITPTPTTTKNIVIEDFTGAWCGNCVDAIATLEDLMQHNTGIISLAVHDGDGMTTAECNEISNKLNVVGRPSLSIDRNYFEGVDNSVIVATQGWPCTNWKTRAAEQLQVVSPVDISLTTTINNATRLLTVNVNAKFTNAGADGDLRINCYILEDEVSEGTGQQWDQQNYRSTVAGHPFFGKPKTIVGYKHKDVLRKCLGTPWGTSGVIPASVNQGSSYQQTYTFTLPTNWNINKLKFVGLVQRYSDNISYREILNAKETNITTFIDEINSKDLFNVYPNPANDKITIHIKDESIEKLITLFDINGKELTKIQLGNLQTEIYIGDLPQGVYFLKLINNNSVAVKKIIKN